MVSKMPTLKTLRKYFPDTRLDDDRLIEVANWVKQYLRQEHISPANNILKAIVSWEDAGISTKEILNDKEILDQIKW